MAVLCTSLSVTAGRLPASAYTRQDSIFPLTVGDTVPNLQLGNKRLSDYENQLVILDFWATWCSPCIAMLPKMDSLQRAFAGKLQVVAVTYQPDSVATPFLERLEKQRGLRYDYPALAGDTLLNRFFPHTTIPHYVWIAVDRFGKPVVRAITDPDVVNAANVERILSRSDTELATKATVPDYPYDRYTPLFNPRPTAGPQGPMIMHTVFTPYKPGLGSGYHQTLVGVRDTLPYRRITFRNLYMVRMYQLVADDFQPLGWNRTILKVKEPDKLIRWARGQEYTDWLSEHGYCYELILPNHMASQATSIVRQQLDAYFTDYRVALEDSTHDCLVLHRTSDRELFRSKGGTPALELGFTGFTISNRPGGLRLFANALGLKHLAHLDTPIVDETAYSGAVDLAIDAPLDDVEAINRELARYDLALTVQPRTIKVLMVYDREVQP